MFTTATTPQKAGGVLLLSNRKASTASELLALFGARQTPDSVTKLKSRTPSATPVSSLVPDLGRPDDYPAGLDQHDVLFSHKESPASTLFVPTASCPYGMDQEQQRQHESQQQGNRVLQTELEQSDVLHDNSMYPDYSSEEPFRYCGIVRAFPQDGQLLHSYPSTAKPFDHSSPNNGELECGDSRVALPPDLVSETPYDLVGSRASTIRDCIEPAPTVESFQIEGSQPHTSNLICLSSALGKDELSTNVNPKSDVSQLVTPRQTPSCRNSARKGRDTNKPKPRATPKKNIISTVPKKANPPTNSESPRLFAPARRHGIRQPSGSKLKPAVSKQPSV